MEIKRFANNETFIQNIIRSIDSNEHNYRRNYGAFYRYFNEKMDETNNPVVAIEFAKEKLAEVVKKRNARDKVKEEKGIVRKPTSYELHKEQSAFNNQVKEQHREEILNLLRSKSGIEDEEVLKKLLTRLRQTKDYFNYSDDLAADRVIFQYKEKLAREATPSEPPSPPTEEDLRKAARIIEYLDPKNVSINLQRFKYYLDSHTIEKAFQFTQDFIKYRQFLRENNLRPNKINMQIFDEYGQDYNKAIEIIKKRQEEGVMPLESKVLSLTKGGTSEANQYMVKFEGQNVPLSRVLQKLYPNLHYARLKKYYATVKNLIFNFGYSLDEAIAYNRREEKVFSNKEFFRQNFPVDPDQAELIFESYFVDDGLTFEESFEKTKQEIYGNRSVTAQKKYKIRIK
jgi:hypothetical protein